MEPETLSRLLQGCTDHTSGARMPPISALLNGSVMAVGLGKAGTLLNKEGDLEKVFFCHQDTTEISTVMKKLSSRNSAEGQQRPKSGEHLLCTAGVLRQTCTCMSLSLQLGAEKGL